jgi:serine/threonine-protein kinase HipA
VWLYGVHVADLRQTRPFRHRLDFTAEALDTFGDAANVLSLAFPVGRAPVSDTQYDDRPVSFFLSGLLPEGNVRSALASRLRVADGEYIPILSAVGYECAGAVQFLKPGERPEQGRTIDLTPAQVVTLVEESPTYPEGHEPQASLAGIQDKILLTRTEQGWAWPEKGAISTHIIKPEPRNGAALDGIIDGEWWALTVARAAGLDAPHVELATFGDRKALVVERYDRTPDGRRIHQEDFCQALGLNPNDKYETTAMPAPRRLQRLVERLAPASTSPSRTRETLLRQVAFNVLIGNGDSHSKNYSVMLLPHGEARLAPLYDVAPTAFMPGRYNQSGHVINGKRDLFRLSDGDLVAEAQTWGVPRRRAEAVVRETIERARTAVDAVPLPDGVEGVRANLDAAWRRRAWPGADLPDERGTNVPGRAVARAGGAARQPQQVTRDPGTSGDD